MLCLITVLCLIAQTYAWTRDDCQRVALAWKAGNVPYSQSTRYNTKQFVTTGKGPYRSDCSGFVSAAWDIAAPGQTTRTITKINIGKDSLIRCDALLHAGRHVALFWGWADAAKTRPIVIEEYTTGRFTEERTWSSLRGYQPIRRVGWDGAAGSPVPTSSGSPPPPPPPTTGAGASCTARGVVGTCMSTSSCRGTSTPGLCPGAANIQCCTSASPSPSPSGGGTSCRVSQALNLRSCGSTSCSIIRVLAAGTTVTKSSETSGSWVRLSSPAGWVSGQYISCSSGNREEGTSEGGPNVGLIVGITIGALVAVAVVVVLTVLYIRRSRAAVDEP